MSKIDIIQQEHLYIQLIKLPNILSISRVLLLPLVWLFVRIQTKQSLFIAAILIIIIFTTDMLDGYIAKRFHLQTKLGMILDHVCDKICTAGILLIMVVYIDFPLWVFFVVFIRDFLNIIANSIFTLRSNEVLKPDILGKISFLLLSIAIIAYSIQWMYISLFEKINPIINILLVLVTILMIISTLNYIRYYQKEWRKY